ncbi:hypothetical protein [Halohasta litorea]|uniref:Uncharacterized protein n=1 Tax=Halohasta litorea TaxID=869891 RepID=A0ABD6DDL4_9EURY|nr:hypothetical protein [Halohasta litorea]
MVSARFREDVSTLPGVVAVGLLCVAAVLAVGNRSVTLVVGFGLLAVGLWQVYLLYRVVVAVEMLVKTDSPS